MADRRERHRRDDSPAGACDIAPLTAIWRWRYEIVLLAAVILASIAVARSAVAAWVAAVVGAALVALMLMRNVRQYVIARAWCVITPHRVRVASIRARIYPSRGKIPIVLLTTREPFGERVHLWCRAGTSVEDFDNVRALLRAACWANDVRVARSRRFAQIVVLDVVRHPLVNAEAMRTLPPALHRAIFCIDVEAYGDPHRTNPDQLAVRNGLYQSVRQAFGRSDVPWDDCYHEDRGDGLFVLVPPEIPKHRLTVPLSHELVMSLRDHNRTHNQESRIRLRMALHAGEVHYDDHGVAGTAINLAFRLLEAEALKAALRESPGVLAIVVSQWFFEEVVRHDPTDDPASYRPVRVSVKETDAVGWVRVPADPTA